MAFQRSMLDWRRGGFKLPWVYMKCILCNGFPETYARLEEGVGLICHGYMCIVLHIFETYLE